MSDKELTRALERAQDELTNLRGELHEMQTLRDGARNNAEYFETLSRDLTAKVEQRDEQIATQVSRIAAQSAELEGIHDRVVKAVVKYGQDNDSCEDGMADFIAEALGISNDEAHEAIDALLYKDVKVTIYARVKSDYEYEVAESEAERLLQSALVADDVEVQTIDTEWDAA